MPKYEIMLIVNPQNVEEAEKIASDVFKGDVKKTQKLENTQLAYEINNTKVANYLLLDVETTGENIKEFTRLANISKSIWRYLVINMDSERALATKDKAPRRDFSERPERNYSDRPRREYSKDKPNFKPQSSKPNPTSEVK